jgi:uncharacterized protein
MVFETYCEVNFCNKIILVTSKLFQSINQKNQMKTTALKIIGKFLLLILFWAGGLATISYFDASIKLLGKTTSAFLYEFLPLLLILIPSILIWKFIDKEKINDLGFSINKFIKNITKGVSFGLLWIALAVFGLFITCETNFNFNLKLGAKMVFIYFIILLINTIMQEVLCRGYLYKIIEKSFSSTAAVVCTSLFFVMLHPGAIESGIIGTLNVFCAGLIFGITRKFSGSLWLPIAIHIVWNFIDSVLLGISPLGLYPHLDWLSVSGDIIYTGGKEGLATSILTLFTFPVMLGILYFDILKLKSN